MPIAPKFAASDRITVTGRVNQDWLRGHLHQHSGIFPVSFVHINPTDLARLTADPPISKRVVKALYDYKVSLFHQIVLSTKIV